MVEGYARVVLTVLASGVGTTCLYPSTTYCGPPPRAGEEIYGFHSRNLLNNASP